HRAGDVQERRAEADAPVGGRCLRGQRRVRGADHQSYPQFKGSIPHKLWITLMLRTSRPHCVEAPPASVFHEQRKCPSRTLGRGGFFRIVKNRTFLPKPYRDVFTGGPEKPSPTQSPPT